jgi:5-methylcytosine-specific restriction protein A
MKRLRMLKPGIQPLRRPRALELRPACPERLRGRALVERNRRFLARHPLCAECLKHDRTSATTQVDHRIPLHLGGTEDERNLQGLCDECHEVKTTAENKARASGTAMFVVS